MAACHRCGTAFEASGNVSRQASCPSCNAWLRSCLNCQHYDPRSKNECVEPHAEPVGAKDASNFCDFFMANKKTGGAKKTEAAADPFEALFKK